MASFDPRELVPLDSSGSPLDTTKINWKALDDTAELPDYVKQALIQSQGQTGLTPEIMKSAKIGTWDLNGQQNYGIQIDPKTAYVPIKDDNGNTVSYADKAGNIVGNAPDLGFTTFGIPIPMAPQASDYRSTYMRPTFKGETINGDPNQPAAYTFGAEGAYPTQTMVDAAVHNEKVAAEGRKIRPVDLLAPLFPVALGLGAGALGGALGLGEAGTAGAGGAGLSATEAAGGATGIGFGSAAEAPGALTIGLANATPAAEAGFLTAPTAAEAATAGAAFPSTSSLGGVATGAGAGAGSSSGGILGTLGSVNSSITSGIQSALAPILGENTAATIAPIASKAVLGAAGNAAVSGITGGDPIKGALTGALTGGALGAFGGAGGILSNLTGLSPSVADMLIGGGAGALGSAATGQNAIMGGLSGVGAGYLNNALSGASDSGSGNYGSGSVVNGSYVPPTGATLAGAAAPVAAGGAGSSIFGGKGGLSGTALALGALAAGSGILGNKGKTTTPTGNSTATPGPEAVAGTLGPYWNKDLATVSSGPVRAVSNPWSSSTPSYWAYGGPEQSYFSNNSLKAFGYADGGMVQDMYIGGAPPQADNMEPLAGGFASGGGVLSRPEVFSTKGGRHYVEGPGDGQSDDIPAALSDGEFVWDASTVARIGNGSSKRGGAILEAARHAIAKDAGSKEVVQKPIKKSPLQYISEAA